MNAKQNSKHTAADAILEGGLREAARLISDIENGEDVVELLRDLFLRGGSSPVIGVTGPPGAGKSTLVDQLVTNIRKKNLTVAVLAVDPSSPFSGGAILGDRVRMSRHDADQGVFIRSMATRGQLGGLANATADTLTVLRAMNWDVILVETVGVGQNEVAIMRHADCVVLMQTPQSGDAVQAVKAGLLEIGDIFVVNKADTADADKTVKALRDMLAFHQSTERWNPEVLKTQAVTGEGVVELLESIDRFQEYFKEHSEFAHARRKTQLRHRLFDICQHRASKLIFAESGISQLDAYLDDVLSKSADPYEIADKLLPASE